MFNNKVINLFSVLFLSTFLTFVFGCSFFSKLDDSKPSGDEMKKIILSMNKVGSNASVKDFKEFKITESYNTKYKNENFYCIKVNYKYSLNVANSKYDIENKDKRYNFVKRGNEWHGNNGWIAKDSINFNSNSGKITIK